MAVVVKCFDHSLLSSIEGTHRDIRDDSFYSTSPRTVPRFPVRRLPLQDISQTAGPFNIDHHRFAHKAYTIEITAISLEDY